MTRFSVVVIRSRKGLNVWERGTHYLSLSNDIDPRGFIETQI